MRKDIRHRAGVIPQREKTGNAGALSRLNPYSAYKDSGVEWLGEIPAHWEVKRVSQISEILRGKFTHRPRNDPALYNGPYPFIQTGDVTRARKEITDYRQTLNERGLGVSKMFPSGTLVMTIAANIGDVAVLDFSACFPDSVVGFVPRSGIERDFLFYVFLAMKPELLREAPVNTQGNLNIERIGSIGSPIPVPSESEQRAIAAFLDRETAKIDALVAKKERLIELLQEKRTALISHAVTKGLDPDVPLKDSGVEWLGEIPEHWEIMRLKQASRIQGGFAFSTDSFRNEGIPVVRMNNIRRGILDLDDVVRIPEHKCKDAFALNEGDIIYGLSGSIGDTGSLGNYAVVRKGDTPAQLNQRVARLRPMIGRITEKFLVGSLQTDVFYGQVLSHTTGTAQFNVSTNDIGNVVLALPPIKEQRAITAFLDLEIAPINALIAKVQEAIDRLKELRTALISAAVTGKIDVREVAA